MTVGAESGQLFFALQRRSENDKRIGTMGRPAVYLQFQLGSKELWRKNIETYTTEDTLKGLEELRKAALGRNKDQDWKSKVDRESNTQS